MNAEYLQQIHGGEISDYFSLNKAIDHTKAIHGIDDGKSLSTIYNSQVKSKGSINTNGLIQPSINLNGLIDTRSSDPLASMLNDTINRISKEIGLEGDYDSLPANMNSIVNTKNQTQDDIHRSQDAVAAALKELKELGAL